MRSIVISVLIAAVCMELSVSYAYPEYPRYYGSNAAASAQVNVPVTRYQSASYGYNEPGRQYQFVQNPQFIQPQGNVVPTQIVTRQAPNQYAPAQIQEYVQNILPRGQSSSQEYLNSNLQGYQPQLQYSNALADPPAQTFGPAVPVPVVPLYYPPNRVQSQAVANEHGLAVQKVIADPRIRDVLVSTPHKKRYMVIYPNGTVDHVDQYQNIVQQHPNYVVLTKGHIMPEVVATSAPSIPPPISVKNTPTKESVVVVEALAAPPTVSNVNVVPPGSPPANPPPISARAVAVVSGNPVVNITTTTASPITSTTPTPTTSTPAPTTTPSPNATTTTTTTEKPDQLVSSASAEAVAEVLPIVPILNASALPNNTGTDSTITSAVSIPVNGSVAVAIAEAVPIVSPLSNSTPETTSESPTSNSSTTTPVPSSSTPIPTTTTPVPTTSNPIPTTTTPVSTSTTPVPTTTPIPTTTEIPTSTPDPTTTAYPTTTTSTSDTPASSTTTTTTKRPGRRNPGEPVLWFGTADFDFWKRLAKNDDAAFDFVYLYDVPPLPRIEKQKTNTMYPNGTVVEETIESVWEHEDDSVPTILRTVQVKHADNASELH